MFADLGCKVPRRNNGLGLTRFKACLSGLEYAARFVKDVREGNVEVLTETTVFSLTKDEKLTIINTTDGICTLQAKSVALAKASKMPVELDCVLVKNICDGFVDSTH